MVWPVPEGGGHNAGFDGLSGLPGGLGHDMVAVGYHFWTTTDLDGDGYPDLIATAEAVEHEYDPVWGRAFGHEEGNPHWLVYRGSENGFPAEPLDWSLPDGGEYLGGFNDLQGDHGLGAEDFGYDNWTTLDINGDGRLDIVVTAKSVPAEWGSAPDILVVGGLDNPRWDVYLGQDDGFSSSPVEWRLPVGGNEQQGFHDLWGVPGIGGQGVGFNHWETTDLDGDGLPDLVVTAVRVADETDSRWNQAFGYPEDPHWQVYRGTANGFATEATAWRLPTGGPTPTGYERLGGFPAALEASAGDPQWTTTDIDGDGVLDLVLTGEFAVDGEDGQVRVFGYDEDPHWRVYRGEADGFATEWTRWNVPAGGTPDRGFHGREDRFFGADWSTFDISGDGVLDLVVPAEAISEGEDAGTATVFGFDAAPYWRVYLGGADGFASEPIEWRVPVGGKALYGFNGTRGTASKLEDESWGMSDLNGDGHLDLVITAQAVPSDLPGWEAQGQVFGYGAKPHWRVHFGGL